METAFLGAFVYVEVPAGQCVNDFDESAADAHCRKGSDARLRVNDHIDRPAFLSYD